LPVAVTTATLLGVSIPVMVCGVEPLVVVDAGAPDPPQPASRAATTAAAAMPQGLSRNLLKLILISNTSVLEISARCTRRLNVSGRESTSRVLRPAA
jgi:hypothetical protein